MRLLLLLLLPAVASAQFIPRSTGGGGACPLASTASAFAASYRSTVLDGATPSYSCDAVTATCVKYGPGANTSCGTNATGEVTCGRVGINDGVWRYYGILNAVNLTATNVLTYAAALDQGNTGFMRNTNAGKPVLVDDAEGLQVKCKTTLTTCASAVENSELSICGTGGALTRRCVCMGDGTTYAWRNLFNLAAGAGTSTTCPAT